MEYKKLQNGSDIRGVAMEGVEGQPVNLTEEAVRNIGSAFIAYLQKRLQKEKLHIAIGRDSRLSGERLVAAFIDGAAALSADVTDFGLASTPAMFMCTVEPGYDFDGRWLAVSITAPSKS